MPLILNASRQPPGGHSFPDPSGYTLRADSIIELLTMIAEYRSTNAMAPGNPAKELEAHYAKECPWLISNVGSTPPATEDPVARWLNRQWRSPVSKWAEAETVRARYTQCEACPYYVADHPFTPEAKRRLIVIGAGHTGDMVGVCKIHHWSCALACAADHLDSPATATECWVAQRAD